MRVVSILISVLAVMASSGAQTAPPSPVSAPPATATPTAPAILGEIHGTVKSGNMPLPGVSITAANTLTGKKILTSTDAQGSYQLQVTSKGRYVIKADFPAFAAVAKERW